MMLSLSRFPQCTLLNRTTDLSLRCLICWLITIQLHTSKAFNTKNAETLSTLKVTWRFWGVGTLQSVWALLCFTSTCVYFNFSAWLSCLPYLPHKWSCDFMVLAKQWSHATGTDNYMQLQLPPCVPSFISVPGCRQYSQIILDHIFHHILSLFVFI